MPLYYSAASSSRISKSKNKAPSLRPPSMFSSHARRKPVQRSKSKSEADQDEDLFEDHLPDAGLVASLATDLSLRDVAQAIQYIQSKMFEDVPNRAPGMNSTRIAEVLNLRRSLPPMVTVAHIRALLVSPTSTEREISELMRAGTIRKIIVPGRGVGGAGIGESLVLMDDWCRAVDANSNVDDHVKAKYLSVIRSRPTAINIPGSLFSADEAKALMHAGFLTFANMSHSSIDILASLGPSSSGTLVSLSRVGSQSASGSMAAVGGEDAVHEAGGGGGGTFTFKQAESHASPRQVGVDFQLSLPSTGPYLRLLTAGRAHLVSLLSKSKYREAPLTVLRERWDGGIAADDPASRLRKARGESTHVLPGRTRKWKQYYGLRFGWVLGECVGAGLVEIFDTGSVGQAARLA